MPELDGGSSYVCHTLNLSLAAPTFFHSSRTTGPAHRLCPAVITYSSEIAQVDKGGKRRDEVSYCSEEAYHASQCLFVISK